MVSSHSDDERARQDSLFRLSYAFLRRFAVVHLPVPDDATLTTIAEREVKRLSASREIATLAARVLGRESGLGRLVSLGPSILRDLIRYASSREGEPLRAVAEGLELLALPQLEGLEESALREADKILGDLFQGHPVLTELRVRLQATDPYAFRS